MNHSSEMTMANAQNFNGTDGQDQVMAQDKLTYLTLGKNKQYQIRVAADRPISVDEINQYTKRLEKLEDSRAEKFGRRNRHRLVSDLVDLKFMEIKEKSLDSYVEVEKLKKLGSKTSHRACKWTITQLEKAWNARQVSALSGQDINCRTLPESKISKNENRNKIEQKMVDGQDVCSFQTLSKTTTTKKNDNDLMESQDISSKTLTETINNETKSETENRPLEKSTKICARWRQLRKPKIYRINVIQSWKTNREIKSQSADAIDLAKIFTDNDVDDWDGLMEKSAWIRNVILGSVMTGDADSDTREVANLITVQPNFLSNEFIGIKFLDYTTFIGGLVMTAITPPNTGATDGKMVEITKTIADLIKDMLKKPKEKWTTTASQNIVFQMKEKPNNDLTITEAVKIVLGSLFATVKFFLTTKKPNWMDLSDFPEGPTIKSKEKAIAQMGSSVNGNHFRLLLENTSGSYAKRQEARLTCGHLLDKHFQECKNIIRNNGVNANWPTDPKEKFNTRGLLVEVSSASNAYKALDAIFDKKATGKTLNQIKAVRQLFTATNEWASGKGATKLVPLEFIETLEEYLEKETGGAVSKNIAEEDQCNDEDFSQFVEEMYTGLDQSEPTGFCAYPAPVIIEENRIIKWKPKPWVEASGVSLAQHIESEILIKARGQGVRQFANLFRLIYYCLENDKEMQNNFGKNHLSRLQPNSTMSKTEFEQLAWKIANRFNPEGIITWYEWRIRMEDPVWTKQRKNESLTAFSSRLMNAHTKAYPENAESKNEKQFLCRKIFMGLYDEDKRKAMISKNSKFLMTVKNPKELVRELQQNDYQCKKLQFWKNQSEEDEYGMYQMQRSTPINNNQITRAEFINEVVKLRRKKSKGANVAEDGDFIIRRNDIPDEEKDRIPNFNIRNYMPAEKFKDLTLKCAKKVNKEYGTDYDFYEEEYSSDEDESTLDTNETTSETDGEDNEERARELDYLDYLNGNDDNSDSNILPLLCVIKEQSGSRKESEVQPVDPPIISFEVGDKSMLKLNGLFDTGAQMSCIEISVLQPILLQNPDMKIEPHNDLDQSFYGLGGSNAKINIAGVINMPKLKLADRTVLQNVKFLVIPDTDSGLQAILGFDIMKLAMQRYGSIMMEYDESKGSPCICFNHKELNVVKDGTEVIK